jgi:IS5 family transposase
MSKQIVMISLEDLVSENHIYRKFSELWDFKGIKKQLNSLEKDNNYKGYGISRLFKCLLLQFMENLSDRELERYLNKNNAAKWFCGFELTEQTPDNTLFVKIRSRIGIELLAKLFNSLRDQLKAKGRSRKIQQEFPELSKRYWGRHFWGSGLF